jgi:uncharacterized protein HemX
MATFSNVLFASSRRERSGGLLVAAAILFAVALGGSGALFGAYTGNVAQNTVAAAYVRV